MPDKTDIGFTAFAGAKIPRRRGMRFASPQKISWLRSYTCVKFAEPEPLFRGDENREAGSGARRSSRG